MSETSRAIPSLVALVGIDWADQKHDVALRVAGTQQLETTQIDMTPEALTEWVAGLRQRFGDGKIGVVLEQSRGALIHALLEHDCFVLYPVNPVTVKRFREAFASSGAKADPTDAKLMLELLEKHRERLHAWAPDEPETRALARLVEGRRKAVNERTQLVQRLGAELKGYFPQALSWSGGDLTSPMALDFLRHWPTLEAVKKVREPSLRRFYTRHHCRSAEKISERLREIRRATPLVRDWAIIEPSVLTVRMLVEQIQALNEGIETYESRLQELFAQHPDAPLFESLPGAGPNLAPRLLAAFGSDRDRFDHPVQMQQYSGIAPVTEQSGKSRWVHRRWAAPKFVRQSFHEFAGHSIRYSRWARAYYELQRERGKGNHAAVRALAFKWIRILWRCWQDRVPYDEKQYLESLCRRGSPLAQRIGLVAAA